MYYFIEVCCNVLGKNLCKIGWLNLHVVYLFSLVIGPPSLQSLDTPLAVPLCHTGKLATDCFLLWPKNIDLQQ